MAEVGVVTRALLAIARDHRDDRALAERICRACMDGLDIDGASMSVLTASVSRTTLWASDATAERLEDLQFTLNEGACMEAATTGRPVLVPDLREGTEIERWPIFAAAVAAQTPIRALFAMPLQWGRTNLGVVDLYRAAPGSLSAAQRRDAISATDTAALMMLEHRISPVRPGVQDDGSRAWLDDSTDHRAEIHQATGMVLAQLEIGATEALARMRGYAFVEQRLLIDVARDVVERRLRFTDAMR